MPAGESGQSAVTDALLRTYDGKNILEICGRCFDYYEYKKDEWVWKANHCAHFIAHVLSIRLGALCWVANGGRRTSISASIRVDEIFNNCTNQKVVELKEVSSTVPVPPVKTPAKKPASEVHLDLPAGPCLIYTTLSKNFKEQTMHMGTHDHKHIGILIGDKVWQYANGKKGPTGMVKELTAEQFSKIYDKSRKTTVTLVSDFPEIVPMPFAILEQACKRADLPTEPPKPKK